MNRLFILYHYSIDRPKEIGSQNPLTPLSDLEFSTAMDRFPIPHQPFGAVNQNGYPNHPSYHSREVPLAAPVLNESITNQNGWVGRTHLPCGLGQSQNHCNGINAYTGQPFQHRTTFDQNLPEIERTYPTQCQGPSSLIESSNTYRASGREPRSVGGKGFVLQAWFPQSHPMEAMPGIQQYQEYQPSLSMTGVESQPSPAIKVEQLKARVAELEKDSARLKEAEDSLLSMARALKAQKAETAFWMERATRLKKIVDQMAPPRKSSEAIIKTVGRVTCSSADSTLPPESTPDRWATKPNTETQSSLVLPCITTALAAPIEAQSVGNGARTSSVSTVDLTIDDHSEPTPDLEYFSAPPASPSHDTSFQGQHSNSSESLYRKLRKRPLEWLQDNHPFTAIKRQRVDGPEGQNTSIEAEATIALADSEAKETRLAKARERRSQKQAEKKAAQAQKEKVDREEQEKVEREEQERERKRQENGRIREAKRLERLEESKKNARARDERKAKKLAQETAQREARWAKEKEEQDRKRREREGMRLPLEKMSSPDYDALDEELFGPGYDDEPPAKGKEHEEVEEERIMIGPRMILLRSWTS